eukprot:scaffold71486_cov30-Tisochrysis_lutea.AAC.3
MQLRTQGAPPPSLGSESGSEPGRQQTTESQVELRQKVDRQRCVRRHRSDGTSGVHTLIRVMARSRVALMGWAAGTLIHPEES